MTEFYEALYQMIYLMLLVILFLDFVVAKFMDLVNVGESTIIAPIIGTAAGWLVLWMSPTTIAGAITGAIVTVIANLIITYAIYPRLADKLDDAADKSTEKRESRDAHIILDGTNKEERVKCLSRHSHNGQYVFEVNATPEIAYETILKTLDIKVIQNIHQHAKIRNAVEEGKHIIRIECPRYTIAFLAKNKEGITYAYLLLTDVCEDGLKLKERMALDKKRNEDFDRIYTIVRNALNKMYTSCSFSMTYGTYKSAYINSANLINKGSEPAYPVKPFSQPKEIADKNAWTCPKCGWINSNSQEDCVGCGYTQKTVESYVTPTNTAANIESSPVTISAETTDEWVCPKCKWINNENQNDCIGCGSSRLPTKIIIKKTKTSSKSKPQSISKTVKTNRINVKLCKKCGGYVTGTSCRKCGAKYK